MTRKEAIKPGDIEVTYSRSPNLKDVLIKGNLNDTPTTQRHHTLWQDKMQNMQSHTIRQQSEKRTRYISHKRKFYLPIKKYSLCTHMQYMQ